MPCRYPGPVSCNCPEVVKKWLDLFPEVRLRRNKMSVKHTYMHTYMQVRLYPCPVSITAVGVSITNLKSSVDLSAVKHEDEVLKVSQGRLPGDVISFL